MGGRSVRAARGRCPRGMRRRAAGLRAHAQPDRAGRECVRRTSCSFSSRPGATAARATAARALPPSALASSPRVPPGATRAARQRYAGASGGHRDFDLRVQRRSTKCCSALPLSQRSWQPFSCNGSLAVSPALSASPSPLPRPSPLPSLSLSLGFLSPPLLLSVLGPHSSPLCAVPTSLCLSVAVCRLPAAKRVASELDRAKRGALPCALMYTAP